jgi:hypothetical protein
MKKSFGARTLVFPTPVWVEESVLGEKGFPDIEKVRPLLFEPEVNTYHGVGKYVGKTYKVGRQIG